MWELPASEGENIIIFVTPFTLSLNILEIEFITGGFRLMRISLLRFFKTSQKYLAYAFLGLFISLLRFLYLAYAILYPIYYITAINLPNAIFGYCDFFQVPKVA